MNCDCECQYETLDDAFKNGDIEVWYMKPDHFRDGIMGAKPEAGFLEHTHIHLGSIRYPLDSPMPVTELFDKLWKMLQGEHWSPNGEARNLIRSKGLRHTSMSVGDCFKHRDSGQVWMVAFNGFEQVH